MPTKSSSMQDSHTSQTRCSRQSSSMQLLPKRRPHQSDDRQSSVCNGQRSRRLCRLPKQLLVDIQSICKWEGCFEEQNEM